MTFFRQELGKSSKNAEDTKVLVVGIICTVAIFSFFTVYEEVHPTPTVHIDLVQTR